MPDGTTLSTQSSSAKSVVSGMTSVPTAANSATAGRLPGQSLLPSTIRLTGQATAQTRLRTPTAPSNVTPNTRTSPARSR